MFRFSFGPAFAAVLGIGVLTVMDGLIKYVAGTHSPAQIAAMRYFFGAIIAFTVFRATRTAWPSGATLRPHAWRSILVASTALSFFYALSVLPLVVALALSFTSPMFIALLAIVILGERPGKMVYAALALGFAGVLVVMWDELTRADTDNLFGVASALFSAVTYALSMVALKSRAAQDPAPTIVLLQNVFAGLFLAPLGLASWTMPQAYEIGIFFGIGLLGTAGHLCLAWAYGRADASRLGVLEYTSFLWAGIIGFVVFSEVPAASTLIGTGLIVAGALLASRSPARKVAINEPDVEIGP